MRSPMFIFILDSSSGAVCDVIFKGGKRNARSPVNSLFSLLFTASCCFLLGLDALLDLPHSGKGTKTGRSSRVGEKTLGWRWQVIVSSALCDITEGRMSGLRFFARTSLLTLPSFKSEASTTINWGTFSYLWVIHWLSGYDQKCIYYLKKKNKKPYLFKKKRK